MAVGQNSFYFSFFDVLMEIGVTFKERNFRKIKSLKKFVNKKIHTTYGFIFLKARSFNTHT